MDSKYETPQKQYKRKFQQLNSQEGNKRLRYTEKNEEVIPWRIRETQKDNNNQTNQSLQNILESIKWMQTKRNTKKKQLIL